MMVGTTDTDRSDFDQLSGLVAGTRRTVVDATPAPPKKQSWFASLFGSSNEQREAPPLNRKAFRLFDSTGKPRERECMECGLEEVSNLNDMSDPCVQNVSAIVLMFHFRWQSRNLCTVLRAQRCFILDA
jgi:hypothetical protein